jgi:hypothetical protein
MYGGGMMDRADILHVQLRHVMRRLARLRADHADAVHRGDMADRRRLAAMIVEVERDRAWLEQQIAKGT